MAPREGIEALLMAGVFISEGVRMPPGSLSARRVREAGSPKALVKVLGAGGTLGAITVAAESTRSSGRPNQRSSPIGSPKNLRQ